MARIRTIKPDFFRHELLQDLSTKHGAHVMLVFAGLLGHCDKLGRFEWRPRILKLDILPFMKFDMADALGVLVAANIVIKYECNGKLYGLIPTFEEHQRIGGKEAQEPAKYPGPPVNESGSTGEALVKHSGLQEGKGREGKGMEEEGKRNVVEARIEKFASPPEPKSLISGSSKSKGSRWASEAVVPDGWVLEGEPYREAAGLPAIDLRAEALKFANYWASKSGGAATKVDWKRTWLNWCLSSNGNSNGSGNRKSQLEQLAEIVAGERAGTIIEN